MGVYPGLRSRRGEWDELKMSTHNPGAKENIKRRKMEEGSGNPEEVREESGRGVSDGASSRDSSRGLMSTTLALWGDPKVRSNTGIELVKQAKQHHREHHEETGNLFRHDERALKRKVRSATAEEWVGACKSLMLLSENNMKTIEGIFTSEICETCEGGSAYTMVLAGTQFRRFRWALREYSRRYLGAGKE